MTYFKAVEFYKLVREYTDKFINNVYIDGLIIYTLKNSKESTISDDIEQIRKALDNFGLPLAKFIITRFESENKTTKTNFDNNYMVFRSLLFAYQSILLDEFKDLERVDKDGLYYYDKKLLFDRLEKMLK